MTDNAEQAVAALIGGLLLQQVATSGVRTFDPTTVTSLVQPILQPLLLSVGLIMLRRSRRRADVAGWATLSGKVIEDSVNRIVSAIEANAEYVSPDAYARQTSGPVSADDWTKRVANTIVTSVVEGFKRGLANRLGFNYKTWISREDTRVRDSHQYLHGKTVHRNDVFQSQYSGATLDRPGDQTAPIGEWINCRCRLSWSRGKHA